MILLCLLQCTYDVHVPKEHHKSVLGRQGARLKKIEVLTNTKINVPRPDDPSEFIRVTGSKEGADKARHEIQSIADEMVCVCSNTCMCGQFSQTACRWIIPGYYSQNLVASAHECMNRTYRRSVQLSTVHECQWSIIKFTVVSLELPIFGSYCAEIYVVYILVHMINRF